MVQVEVGLRVFRSGKYSPGAAENIHLLKRLLFHFIIEMGKFIGIECCADIDENDLKQQGPSQPTQARIDLLTI